MTRWIALRNHLPLFGIVASLFLLVVSAQYYPGGTAEDSAAIGYDWSRNYISTLFLTMALNGEPNPGRNFAIPGMMLLCGSLGLVFGGISRRPELTWQRKSIEVGGIGSVVYAFLAVVTPLHDLLVTFSVTFFAIAVLALQVWLCQERRIGLFGWGLICLATFVCSLVIYYGNVWMDCLAVAQKLTFAISLVWLLNCYYLLGEEY